jgi:hypothetical protein
LFEGTGCQGCDQHPLIDWKWVLWAFGARLCKTCWGARTITDDVLGRTGELRYEWECYQRLRLSSLPMPDSEDFGHVRERRRWRADVDMLHSIVHERETKMRVLAKIKEKQRRKLVREEARARQNDVREQRKRDLIRMMTTTFTVTEEQLETSESYRKHSKISRPLSARFNRTHMRQILEELPDACRRKREN